MHTKSITIALLAASSITLCYEPVGIARNIIREIKAVSIIKLTELHKSEIVKTPSNPAQIAKIQTAIRSLHTSSNYAIPKLELDDARTFLLSALEAAEFYKHLNQEQLTQITALINSGKNEASLHK